MGSPRVQPPYQAPYPHVGVCVCLPVVMHAGEQVHEWACDYVACLLGECRCHAITTEAAWQEAAEAARREREDLEALEEDRLQWLEEAPLGEHPLDDA